MTNEDDYIDADLDAPKDDVERKIKRLEDQIARVSAIGDRKVLWAAFGLVVFILAFRLLDLNAWIAIVVVPVVVIGGLAYVMFENIRKKRNIMIRHGLKCPACGHLPQPINAAGVYYSKQCLKCGADLEI